jgi:polyisoprenoid-binding protein YceI
MSDTTTAPSTTGTWAIDGNHTEIGFTARHLVVTKVRGKFAEFEASIVVPESGPTDAVINATIQSASVDTGNEDRNAHIKGADFLDVENFPTITFVGTKVEATGGNDYKVTGDLTVKGVTKSVTLDVEFNGVSGDPWGGTRAGFEAKTEIDRRDFGLDFNVALDTGGVLVSEKIKFELEVQAVLQAS